MDAALHRRHLDTADLSPTEFGIYMRLLMHAWNHNARVPADVIKLSFITGCERRFWHRFGAHILSTPR
jgi:uncharacterized protein YdaU (DUF1376 family)